jgi:RNA recognition motif-containing protein
MFASEEIQKKAIKEMNGKEIEGRKIIVSIFINNSNKRANGASKASTA